METPDLSGLDIGLIHIGAAIISPDWWSLRDVLGTHWRFYVNSDDGVIVETARGATALKAGRSYVLPAGVRFSTSTDRAMVQTYVHFEIPGIYGLILRGLFDDLISLPEDFALRDMVAAIVKHKALGEPIDTLVQVQTKAVLYAAVAHHLASLPPERREYLGQHALGLQPLLPALHHMESRFAETLSNNALAEMCCMSEGHFIRKFRAQVGRSPAQYVLERRVHRAAHLLRQTEWGIERIAAECGFGSRFYFHRIFARESGMTPAAYRRCTET